MALKWTIPCDECRKEIDKSISKISIKSDKKMGGNSKMNKGIKIDDKHTWIIAKYGPVIMCDNNGEVTFKKVRKNINLEKLKKGGYKLEELLLSEEDKLKSNGKFLGKIDDQDIVLKNGKFGLYIQMNGKNKSIKTDKKFENVTLEDVKRSLKGLGGNVLKKLTETTSIRKGKYGPYVFHKTKDMKKPLFISLKKTRVEDVDMEWVYENM